MVLGFSYSMINSNGFFFLPEANYLGIVVACVCLPVRPSVRSSVFAMQNTLVKIPIVSGVDRPWPSVYLLHVFGAIYCSKQPMVFRRLMSLLFSKKDGSTRITVILAHWKLMWLSYYFRQKVYSSYQATISQELGGLEKDVTCLKEAEEKVFVSFPNKDYNKEVKKAIVMRLLF